MKQQVISHLQKYQGQIDQLSQEIQNDEAQLASKRAGLEQLRGAYAAMWTMAQENGLVNEQGQIVVPEPTEPPAPAVEEVEAEVVQEA